MMANLVPILCILIITICHIDGKPTESVVSSCTSCERLTQISKKFHDLLSIKEVRDSITEYSGPLGTCTDNDEVVTSPPAEQEETVDPECMLCKRVFEQIYAYLQENRTQEAIEDALDKVCDELFPSSKKKSCRKFIDSYTAQIIDIVLQTTDPKEACIILGVCKPRKQVEYSSDSREEVEEIVEVIPLTLLGPKAEKMKKMTSKDECDRCDRILSIIGKYFPDQTLTKEDEKMSEKNNSTRNNSVELNHEVEGKPRLACAECLVFAKEIQTKLYDHKTEEEVTKFITNGLCLHFPNKEIKESCKYFVTEYGESAMQMIALKIFDPHTFCSKELRVCSKVQSSHESEIESPSSEFDFIDKKIEETCSLCVDMIQKMESQKDGDEKAKTICSQYKQTEKNAKCIDIADAFGKHFEKMIGFDSAEKICKTVDLCYTSAHSHLLGGQKCSFGPSYWCNTKAHADACKAVDFCRKKVWIPIE
ncbi:prosaposin-like [Panonychus citri]|uniref:prosaposin-like n=1 Tax=Panonychus citri TaxID=50023 RepID=UPI00230746A6|nr:prosaposin-like [Panonychus citri]